MKKTLSLLLSVLLALSLLLMGALADEEELEVIPEGENQQALETEGELGNPDEVQELTATVLYYNGEELVATQEVRNGDAFIQPEAPEAPEGQVFDGWYLDGVKLFADAEQPDTAAVTDGVMYIYVNAAFVEAVQPTEEQPSEQPTEEQPSEQPSEEQPSEQPTEEQPSEQPSEEQPSEEQPTEQPSEEQPTEQPSEEQPSEQPSEEQPAPAIPTARELTYNGEAQALLSVGEGAACLYSLDGETYGEEIPTATNAGEYTVFYKTAEDAEPTILTVVIAKADVILTAPTANVEG